MLALFYSVQFPHLQWRAGARPPRSCLRPLGTCCTAGALVAGAHHRHVFHPYRAPQRHFNCQDLARRPRRRRLIGRRVSNLLLMMEPAIGLHGVSIRRHWFFPVPGRASEPFREVSRMQRSETHRPAANGGCVGVRALQAACATLPHLSSRSVYVASCRALH